jgi:hypothetical protein
MSITCMTKNDMQNWEMRYVLQMHFLVRCYKGGAQYEMDDFVRTL